MFIPSGTRVTINSFPMNVTPRPTHRVCGRSGSMVRIQPLGGGGAATLICPTKLIRF